MIHEADNKEFQLNFILIYKRDKLPGHFNILTVTFQPELKESLFFSYPQNDKVHRNQGKDP